MRFIEEFWKVEYYRKFIEESFISDCLLDIADHYLKQSDTDVKKYGIYILQSEKKIDSLLTFVKQHCFEKEFPFSSRELSEEDLSIASDKCIEPYYIYKGRALYYDEEYSKQTDKKVKFEKLSLSIGDYISASAFSTDSDDEKLLQDKIISLLQEWTKLMIQTCSDFSELNHWMIKLKRTHPFIITLDCLATSTEQNNLKSNIDFPKAIEFLKNADEEHYPYYVKRFILTYLMKAVFDPKILEGFDETIIPEAYYRDVQWNWSHLESSLHKIAAID